MEQKPPLLFSKIEDTSKEFNDEALQAQRQLDNKIREAGSWLKSLAAPIKTEIFVDYAEGEKIGFAIHRVKDEWFFTWTNALERDSTGNMEWRHISYASLEIKVLLFSHLPQLLLAMEDTQRNLIIKLREGAIAASKITFK